MHRRGSEAEDDAHPCPAVVDGDLPSPAVVEEHDRPAADSGVEVAPAEVDGRHRRDSEACHWADSAADRFVPWAAEHDHPAVVVAVEPDQTSRPAAGAAEEPLRWKEPSPAASQSRRKTGKRPAALRNWNRLRTSPRNGDKQIGLGPSVLCGGGFRARWESRPQCCILEAQPIPTIYRYTLSRRPLQGLPAGSRLEHATRAVKRYSHSIVAGGFELMS